MRMGAGKGFNGTLKSIAPGAGDPVVTTAGWSFIALGA
jgi:hypothetical protein